jgi:hypothetical protein
VLPREELNIPKVMPLQRDVNSPNFPFFFIADVAFYLSKRIRKPYENDLENVTRIFKEKLCKYHSSVERAPNSELFKYRFLGWSVQLMT